MSEDDIGSPAYKQQRRAIRLTFAYEGDDIRLIGSRRVDKLVPPSDALGGYEEQHGFWAEVRDAEGAMLYRQVLHDPIGHDAEVFPEEMGQPIRRVPVERPAGVFSVLVPDLDRADHIAVISIPPAPPPGGAKAAEIIRVPLGREREPDQKGGAP